MNDEDEGDMDNRLFSVNGKGKDLLCAAIKLAFQQSGQLTCRAWAFNKARGLILLSHPEGAANPLPSPLSPQSTFGMVSEWLDTPEAATVELTKWEENLAHDGDNSPGWRVYVEDWGHLGEFYYPICAVKRVYLWHGK